MRKKKIAIVCAAGIGDALIFQIAACQLQLRGAQVTTFSQHLPGFGKWLEGYSLAYQPPLDQIEETFRDFDAVFLQHDNSPKAKKIHALPLPVYTFYGTHQVHKHGPLHPTRDYVADPHLTMVDNLLLALQKLFATGPVTADNGLKPPRGLLHRRYAKRIAIHPLSTAPSKNWPREKFLRFAETFQAEGFDPVFLVPSADRSEWGSPDLSTLEKLASFLYESGSFLGNDSGPGHLASYLQIPHLIIAREVALMRIWQPGWLKGKICFPPSWLPNWKILRNEGWKYFVPTKTVIHAFKESVLGLPPKTT